jgi:hypothetical protein
MKRVAVLLLVLGMNLAHADSVKIKVPDNVKWKEECGTCHVAYPPRLLTAEDWGQLMSTLDKHFGTNAALESTENRTILGFLKRHSGNGKLYSATSLRISDTPWFRREHRSISPAEWTNPEVKSRSNCSACHGKSVLGN